MGVGEEAASATAAAEAASTTAGTSAAQAESRTAPTGEGGEGWQDPANGLARPEKPLSATDRLRITLLRNVRYHEDREAFFTLVNRFLNTAVLLSGTGVVATLTTTHHGWSRDIAISTAVIGAVQLVFDPSRRQFQHESLRVRFLELLSDLTDATQVETRRNADNLYGQEPPTFYAVDALAFNAGQKALRRPASTFLIVSPWQRFMKNWIRFTDMEFRERGPDAPKGHGATGHQAASRPASPSPSNSAST